MNNKFMNKRIFIFSLLSLFTGISSIFAQNLSFSLEWKDNIKYGLNNNQNQDALYFEGATYDFAKSNLPFLYKEVEGMNGSEIDQLEIINPVYEKLSTDQASIISSKLIDEEVKLNFENSIIKKQNRSFLKLQPFRKTTTGEIERLIAFELNVKTKKYVRTSNRLKSWNFASNSMLANGQWYKIAVTSDGVFKLDKNFLKSLGLDVNNIDPRDIRLFGYGGGSLPELNSIDRPDDLQENAIFVKGESDGSFDANDFISFYGKGQVNWYYDSSRNVFRHRINNTADTSFYFLTTELGRGKRVQTVPNPDPELNPGAINTIVSTYDDYQYHESNRVNLIKSGQEWFGESFDNQLSYDFAFDFTGIDLNAQAKLNVHAIARAGVVSSYEIETSGQKFSLSCNSTVLTRYEVGFARGSIGTYDFTPSGNIVNVRITYNKPQAVAKGWLNYIDVNVRRNLNFNGGQMAFRDKNSVFSNSYATFNINSSNNIQVWDVTDHFNVEAKTVVNNGASKSFIGTSNELKEYIAFNSYDSLNVFHKGTVSNQNLHALSKVDMVIVSHPNFLNASNSLKSIHSAEGLSVEVVTPQQIYNEFSSGAQDPIAIRSLLKMLYDRATIPDELPKYLLIFGDASYDFKDRINGNTNYVMSFQSKNSLDPVSSYVSDDYFVLLDDDEGEWRNTSINPDKMDVSVGRFPVQTIEEANAMVQKVQSYYASNSLGDWRNTITFVGDDGDGVTHMAQSNQLSQMVALNAKDKNLNKVFLDAFQRISTATGPRFPDANEAIRRSVDNGSLIVNYTGHGGETGWAHERVLDIATITGWNNLQNLPLFMTATCEFSRFDDPLRTSAGELVLLNPNGGGVALMTTTRLVYSSPNYFLNQTFYNNVFERNPDGSTKRLGDIMLIVKNQNASQGNTRNFSLLGDPALKLAIPNYNVVTTAINGKPISQIDTLTALSKVTVTGYVANEQGQKQTNYNGIIYPTVFDKENEKKTLVAEFRYNTQESKVFKGKATVNNGDFTFDFVVPKDISYTYGAGKISYYTEDGVEDGNGYSTDFVIGGSNPSAIADEVGPEISLFMNDRTFIFGGMTSESPVLLADLFDEQGINTVGNGIGHDLVAIIDANTDNSIILNDYYEAETDEYKRGVIRFPLEGLSDGKHTLTLKAWDNANNSSEKSIEFNVVSSKEVEIENLVNYPNPFTTNTEFIFQHNQPGVPLDIKLEVFTVSGKLVKSINEVVVSEGYLARGISWNGRDDYGDRIGKGVYVYKLKVRSRNGTITEKYEKLVIL